MNAWKGFGISVAILGDVIVVGSCLQDAGGLTDPGVAYIFDKPDTGWQDMTETYSITAADRQAADEFGVSAAIGGTGIVIGAWMENPVGAVDAGSAYVFQFSDVDLHYRSFTSIAAQDGWIRNPRRRAEREDLLIPPR